MPEDKKLEFLKREEIRTMSKDIAELREKEAKEKISEIAGEKPKEIKETPLSQKAELQPKKRAFSLKIKLPKPPSLRERIFLRAALIILLALIAFFLITFWYWYFNIQKEIPEVPEKTLLPKKEEQPSLPRSEIFEQSKVLEGEGLKIALNELFAQEGAFLRLLVKNPPESQFWALDRVFEELGDAVPAELSENGELFVYFQKEGKRFGFISKPALPVNDLVSSLEPKLEQNFQNFFSLMAKNSPALAGFRETNYQGTAIRFQTFSLKDLGIVYAFYNDYFIFASSFESAKKLIDQLRQ